MGHLPRNNPAETSASLRLVDLRHDYRTGEHNLLTDFYVPCLQQSQTYYRAVGFFSSSALAAAARGLAHFIKRSGQMFLVASPVLEEADGKTLIDAWHDSSNLQNVVGRLLARSLEPDQIETLLVRRRLECLAWLMSERRLQIRIAIPQVDQGLDPRSLYHEKLGIFEDDVHDCVAFVGSINETAAGWSKNFEAFDVYASWRPEDSDRVQRKRQIFAALWENATPGLRVMELPEAARERLLRFRPSVTPDIDPEEAEIMASMSASPETSERRLWPHQEAALGEWRKNGFRGILAMATGTGKTLTALHAAALSAPNVATVILVPTLPLVEQWVAEVRRFYARCQIIECTGGTGAWAQTLSTQLGILRATRLNPDSDSRLVVVSTMASASGDKFQLCWNEFPSEMVQVIADEVHHLGASTLQNCLNIPSLRRLGLSATPERQWDDIGTDAIVRYFGPTIFEYSVKDAIGDGRLCRYEYRPFFAYLNEDEFDEYCRITTEVDKLVATTAADRDTKSAPKSSTQLQRLLERRALIKKKAKDKPNAFRRVLANSPPSPFIVFCEDQEQLASLRAVMNESHVSFVTYTSEQSSWQRGKTLELFKEKTADAVLAIRCLDEGVDVPACKSCVIVASSSSTREFIQRRGRVLRISGPNKRAVVFDIVVLPIVPRLPGDLGVAERVIRQELVRVNLMVEASEHEWAVRGRIKDELEQFGLGSLAFI